MSSKIQVRHAYTLADLDQNTTLCLACSLPPFRKGVHTIQSQSLPTTPTTSSPTLTLAKGSSSSGYSELLKEKEAYMSFLKQQGFYITPCCARPICPDCTKANPRLTRYNPCLACLSGIDAAGKDHRSPLDVTNINGAVRDEDVFVVGEDEDEADESEPPPPAYVSDPEELVPLEATALPSAKDIGPPNIAGTNPPVTDSGQPHGPRKYFMNKRDTLQGLAFKFGIDGRELCRLNNFPTSTLTTTPHILHTRSYIILPLSAMSHPQNEEVRDREAKRTREKAERKLQTLMKEVHPGIARAYVALADDEQVQTSYLRKRKELAPEGVGDTNVNGSSLEAAAIEQYLEDEDWETNEQRQGRFPATVSLPCTRK